MGDADQAGRVPRYRSHADQPTQRVAQQGCTDPVSYTHLDVYKRQSLERHALAKRAKDIGSAAVFVALGIVVSVWGLVLFL